MKKAMILAVVASAAMLSACHTSGKVDNFTIDVDAVSSATTAVDVPYKVANGYFVRNDVKKLPNGKISKQKDFEASFGMAAVMGNDGRPTEIDFDNQYVIAVSKPVTDRFTELEPVSLKATAMAGWCLSTARRQANNSATACSRAWWLWSTRNIAAW